jgi:hypothetical protein
MKLIRFSEVKKGQKFILGKKSPFVSREILEPLRALGMAKNF